jgi:hypothetical protein
METATTTARRKPDGHGDEPGILTVFVVTVVLVVVNS